MPFPVRAGAACLTCLLPYDSQPASLLPAALRTPHLSAGLCCGAPYKSEGTAPCCLCSRAACLPSATVLCLPSATVLLVCPVPQPLLVCPVPQPLSMRGVAWGGVVRVRAHARRRRGADHGGMRVTHCPEGSVPENVCAHARAGVCCRTCPTWSATRWTSWQRSPTSLGICWWQSMRA